MLNRHNPRAARGPVGAAAPELLALVGTVAGCSQLHRASADGTGGRGGLRLGGFNRHGNARLPRLSLWPWMHHRHRNRYRRWCGLRTGLAGCVARHRLHGILHAFASRPERIPSRKIHLDRLAPLEPALRDALYIGKRIPTVLLPVLAVEPLDMADKLIAPHHLSLHVLRRVLHVQQGLVVCQHDHRMEVGIKRLIEQAAEESPVLSVNDGLHELHVPRVLRYGRVDAFAAPPRAVAEGPDERAIGLDLDVAHEVLALHDEGVGGRDNEEVDLRRHVPELEVEVVHEDERVVGVLELEGDAPLPRDAAPQQGDVALEALRVAPVHNRAERLHLLQHELAVEGALVEEDRLVPAGEAVGEHGRSPWSVVMGASSESSRTRQDGIVRRCASRRSGGRRVQ